MADLSYATKRKKRIIEEKLGADWETQYPGKSIDAVYNIVTGDTRKNLFCKVRPEVKSQLDEMVEYHDLKMAEMVEKLVQEEYDRFVAAKEDDVNRVASQFAQTG